MLYSQNERRYGAENFEKDLFLGQLHPTGIYKNSEDFDYRVWWRQHSILEKSIKIVQYDKTLLINNIFINISSKEELMPSLYM